jgi:hypothetical protein
MMVGMQGGGYTEDLTGMGGGGGEVHAGLKVQVDPLSNPGEESDDGIEEGDWTAEEIAECVPHAPRHTEHRAQSTEHRAQSTENRAQCTVHKAG